MKISFDNPDIEDKYLSYSEPIRSKLLSLRQLVLETASEIEGIEQIEEALKWGQPSFLTKPKSGSTIRIDRIKSRPTKYAMYFICTTNLVESFQEQYPTTFNYEGGRSLVFDVDEEIPETELRDCVTQALTYHNNKKQ